MEMVRARAPGKIILSGEHAVVHGSTAIAASIDLYTRVSFYPSPQGSHGEGSVVIDLTDSGLAFSWPLERLQEVLSIFSPLPSSPGACTVEFSRSISSLVQEQNVPEAKIWLTAGLSAFLHLYTSIQGLKPGKVVVTSDLPLGSGLGSSAAFCVSLAAALLAKSMAIDSENHSSGWIRFEEKDLELVNKWAFEGEKIIHGKPSGIDNTVSTFGNMIVFRLGELNNVKSSTPLRLLITNTKVGRNTKALVAGVAERLTRHPDAMAAVFTAIDSISKELSTIIQQPASNDMDITEREEKIEELMEMNQGLLQCMGVSHSSIETVLQTILKYKLSSKLTGAGGGGCVLTLLPTRLSTVVIDKLMDELQSCGFECFVVEAGGRGVEVCFCTS